MKHNKTKLYVIAVLTFLIFAIVFFNTTPTVIIVSAADAAETYKTKCAMCHSPKAEKAFDPSKTDEVLVEVVLKGKKGEKPPFMPAYETKGMTAEQAKELVTYMRELRK